MAKPRPLAVLDTLDARTKFLVSNGDGKSFLTNKGTYVNTFDITGSYQIFELNAETANQSMAITSKGGYLYLVNPNNLAGIKITLSVPAKGTVINVKNVSSSKTVTIATAVDDITNMILQPLESVTLVYTGSKWVII